MARLLLTDGSSSLLLTDGTSALLLSQVDGDTVDAGPIAFDAESSLHLVFADFLDPITFDATSEITLELAPLAWMRPIDFDARGRMSLLFQTRGTRRRTVVVTSDGDSYGELGDARHGPITFELNKWAEASFSIGLDDPRSALVLDDEFREVQLWRGDELLVFGPMVTPSKASRSRALDVDVKGPAWHLSRRHVGKAERTDYLLNGDFEDGLAHWSPVVSVLQTYYHLEGEQTVPPAAEIVRSPVYTGARALRAENFVANTENQIFQTFEWSVDDADNPDGDVWTLSGYLYVESFTAPAFGFDAVVFRRYSTTEPDPDPIVLAAAPTAKLQLQSTGYRVDEDTPLNQWVPVSIEFTQPPKAGEAETIYVALRPPVGVVHYDRFRLTRVESTSWYQQDQADIVADLVEHAQDPAYDKDDVNIEALAPATGVLRDLVAVHHEHPNIWRTILDFTDLDNGIDVSEVVTPTRRQLAVHYPAKGQHLPHLELRVGRNIADFAWSYDGDSASNAVIVLGTGNGSAREEAFAIDPTAFAGGLTLEEVFSAPPDTRIERLEPLAIEELAVAKAPEVVAVKTFPDPGDRAEANDPRRLIGRLWHGDTVPVNLTMGPLSIVGVFRIVRLTINPDDTLDMVLNRRDIHR